MKKVQVNALIAPATNKKLVAEAKRNHRSRKEHLSWLIEELFNLNTEENETT